MEWEYSSSLTVTCDENKRYLMAGLQRSKPFDVDLAGHVRRRCVAGGLDRMVSPLSFKSMREHTKVVCTYRPPT